MRASGAKPAAAAGGGARRTAGGAARRRPSPAPQRDGAPESPT
eukprot:gene28704-43630_t